MYICKHVPFSFSALKNAYFVVKYGEIPHRQVTTSGGGGPARSTSGGTWRRNYILQGIHRHKHKDNIYKCVCNCIYIYTYIYLLHVYGDMRL